ncbi:MAG: DUF4751 family protein [Cyanobacteria bacterium P01_F01_bin.86]
MTVLLSATAIAPIANAQSTTLVPILQSSQDSLVNRAVIDNIVPVVDPTLVAAAIPVVPVHNTASGESVGQTNNFLKYKTWGGSNWSGRIFADGQFLHQSQANSAMHLDTIINYITSDGSEWTATANPEAKTFTHTNRETGASHDDTILIYKDWDGNDQTMRFE